MCWYITGSPPPAALKNEVMKNLSVSSMVTAPASTGITAISRKAVISQVQQKIGIFSRSTPGARMLRMVAMTLIAPMIELMPIMWMARMVKAIELLPCRLSGGYRVQPVDGAPPGMNSVDSSIRNANGRIQNDQLFMRGRAMSGAPICSGTIQLARPTKAGITAPKIITSACMVVIWLKKSGLTCCRPGTASSRRITTLNSAPMVTIVKENSRYSVPMSLWLVENSQRSTKPCLWPWSSAWWRSAVVGVLDMASAWNTCVVVVDQPADGAAASIWAVASSAGSSAAGAATGSGASPPRSAASHWSNSARGTARTTIGLKS